MNSLDNYMKVANCHTGEIDGYGYAFASGNRNGVMLLDLRTKRLLDDLSIFQNEKDEKRIDILIKRKLIHLKNRPIYYLPISRSVIKSIGIWLHVTNNCNLDCDYCYITNKKDKRSMTIETANLFLSKLENTVKQHNLKFIQIKFAGGEPTMNKKVIIFIADEVQKRFVDNGIFIQLRLITNGTLLDSKWIKLLKTYSIGFCISLDGVRKWNDATRPYKNGAGSFKQIHKNLKMCMEEGLQPGILTTITEENIEGIPLLSRFLIDLNLRFRYAVYRDNSGNYKKYESFIDKLMYPLDDCYDYYDKAIREQKAFFSHQLADIHLDKKPHFKSCNIGYSGLIINHVGKMFLCQAGMNKLSIGCLTDKKTLLQIMWNQKTLPDLYKKNVLEYNKCKECKWALSCGGGCSLINLSANGSTNTSSPYCKLFKKMIPRLIKLKALQIIQTSLKI
ncbi:MAG: radical SAM protein [Patescibacteria group bacterium]